MEKSTHSPLYAAVQERLVQMRKDAGLTQRALAEKLEREHSFIWRLEHGERRIDVLEWFWICEACGVDAAEVYAELVDEFHV